MLKAFLPGAIGYPCLEMLYRGRTHYSMAIAGGISTWILSKASRKPGKLLTKSLVCSLGITGVEYLAGQIWNRRYEVWDYRKIPLNYQGQICLPYTLLWFALSAGVLFLMETKTNETGGRIAQ